MDKRNKHAFQKIGFSKKCILNVVSKNQIDQMYFVYRYEQLWLTYLHGDRSAVRLPPKSAGDIVAHIDCIAAF